MGSSVCAKRSVFQLNSRFSEFSLSSCTSNVVNAFQHCVKSVTVKACKLYFS